MNLENIKNSQEFNEFIRSFEKYPKEKQEEIKSYFITAMEIYYCLHSYTIAKKFILHNQEINEIPSSIVELIDNVLKLL